MISGTGAACRTHLADQLDAAHARQAVIGNDEIRRDLLHAGQRVERVVEMVDDHAGRQRARQGFEQAARSVLGFDDQHAFAAAPAEIGRRAGC